VFFGFSGIVNWAVAVSERKNSTKNIVKK